MPTVFHQNDTIWVRDNYSARRAPSYSEYVFVGYFDKNKGVGRFGDATYTASMNGKYVGFKAKQHFVTCYLCQGEGTVKPEGFAETATYRVKCPHCEGNGQANEMLMGNYTRYQINRKDAVMTAEEYAPILQMQQEVKERQRLSNQAREDRINDLVGNLLLKAEAIFQLVNQQSRPGFLKEGEEPIDIELEMAKWLYNINEGELRTSAYRVIESRKPKCSIKDCTTKATYDDLCYTHWSIAQLARQEATA